MARLAESLSRLFGRVEILARGADEDRRAAEEALRRGDHLDARAHARSLLARVPGSPLGLALWADAAEPLWLHDEAAEALSALADQVPWRQDVWLRLGLASLRAGGEGREALERAATGDDPSLARQALLALADLDIAEGQPARAERWLDRVPSHPEHPDAGLALRRAECAWALDRPERIDTEVLADLDTEQRGPLGPAGPPLAGRVRLVEARMARRYPEQARGGDPLLLALGAMLLDAPGADDLVAELLAECRDAAVVAKVREALEEVGIGGARWDAAFALAEGRRDDARAALLSAAEQGDAAAADALLQQTIRARDRDGLRALERIEVELRAPYAQLLEAATHREAGRDREALEALSSAIGATEGWAEEETFAIVGGWVDREGTSAWDAIVHELRLSAAALLRDDRVASIESLAVERRRPLFVAVLGEFNAGKSTFLNALLGTDVAPTGIRPTTASLHWVAWAPDPFARIEVEGGSDRVVPHAELKATLEALREDGEKTGRAYIYAPIERLKRIEVIDTPGFNAPEESHAEQARAGIEEAHLVLWLLDAAAPLKDSERRVIEEIAELGLPIQVLVNKRDRVEGEVDRVMGHVERSLSEVGIVSLEQPVAFSARRALAGRLGDDEALAASGWEAVERLLSERVVDRADVLRERALRRKASRIVEQLIETSTRRRASAERERERSLARIEARRSLVAYLRAHRAVIAGRLVERLDEALSALRLDARPVAALDEVRRAHPEIRAYLVDRTVARLTRPLLDALAAEARERRLEAGLDRVAIEPVVRAVLSGAAACHPGEAIDDGAVHAVVEACLGQSADRLAASDETPPEAADDALHHRLTGLSQALAD